MAPMFQSLSRFAAVLCLVAVCLPIVTAFFSRVAPTSAGGPALASASGAEPALRAPKLYLLFLAYDSLPNEEIWARLLARARRGQDYEAFVHCVDEAACHHSLRDRESFQVVPTVPSQWCVDLVSPMNALLAAALGREAGHPHDKFIFLSDSTVPIKPFEHIQHQLLVLEGLNSSFCIWPWRTWAWHDGKEVAVKHDQWLVLSREHATMALHFKETPAEMEGLLTPLRWANVEWLARALYTWHKDMMTDKVLGFMSGYLGFGVLNFLAPPNLNGCVDEYWHFASIFGYVNRKAGAAGGLSLPGLSGSAGRIIMDQENFNRAQGSCHTYARFSDDHFPELTAALARANGTELEESHRKHPTWFETLSPATMEVFRSSPLLFARKVNQRTAFVGGLSLPEAFERFIFRPRAGQ